MAVDKLVDSAQLDSDLTSVANAIRAKSGGSSQLAFPAGFVSEVQAIPSGGGGMTPPVNAVAQFEVSILFSSQPEKIIIDFSDVIQKMTADRTYAWSLILWRDDVVSASSYSYLVDTSIFAGRISTALCDANLANDISTAAGSMTSGVNLNSSSNASSKSFSSGKETITLSGTTTRDRTGKFKGVFTVVAPWTDSYSGEKVTTCPTNFLTYTAVS